MNVFSFSVARVLFNHIGKSGLNDSSVEELKKRYGGWFPFLLKLLPLDFICKLFSTENKVFCFLRKWYHTGKLLFLEVS